VGEIGRLFLHLMEETAGSLARRGMLEGMLEGKVILKNKIIKYIRYITYINILLLAYT
jgi:hypothetical protein